MTHIFILSIISFPIIEIQGYMPPSYDVAAYSEETKDLAIKNREIIRLTKKIESLLKYSLNKNSAGNC